MEKASNIINANKLTLCNLFITIPENCINVYILASGATCQNSYPLFLVARAVLLLFTLPGLFVFPYLIKRKLDHFV